MSQSNNYLALDVGERRIGVALAGSSVRIAVPLEAVPVDGHELERLAELVAKEDVGTLVVGYPRNQLGEATAQTAYIEKFAEQLKGIAPKMVFQDESVTSVLAEGQLKALGRPYSKGDIDARAAAIILQDHLEGLA